MVVVAVSTVAAMAAVTANPQIGTISTNKKGGQAAFFFFHLCELCGSSVFSAVLSFFSNLEL